MSAEAHKAVVRRFADEMLSQHTLAVADELFTANFIDHDADAPEGRASGVEGAKTEVGGYVNAFPDMRVAIDELIAEGDRVFMRARLSGTHRGDLAGLPPTGKQVEVWAWQVFRFSGGRIAEAWLHIDRLGLLQQLGAVPPPVAPTSVY